MSTQATRRNERDARVDKTPGVDASWEDSTWHAIQDSYTKDILTQQGSYR